MCGICGIIKFSQAEANPSSSAITQMIRILKHRGPDDEGYFIHKNTALGHVRLSIIDLSSAGHQPMFSHDKRYCMVYNGEVYNYIELKETLKNHYPFCTQTDSEVALAAYIQWGPACLDKFNGMFAFAVYDTHTGDLFIARDRFGVKPFYYYMDDSALIFASEQQAILPFLKDKKPNPKAIYEYLLYNRTDQGNDTFFEGIRKLPHGSYATIKNGQWNIQKWYDLSQSLKPPFQDPHEFYDALTQAIRFKLRSDVPVGVCLSGGLDSSTIVSIILKEFGLNTLNTFSAVYGKGDPADESEFINLYRPHLSNMFFTNPTAQSLAADLDRFVQAHSEPVATLGPYAQFKVMELASSYVKVTLDGQGADEQLAGYHYFFGGYFKQLFEEFHWLKLAAEAGTYLKKYKSLFALKYFVLYMMPSGLKNRMSKFTHNYIAGDFYREETKHSRITDKLYNPHTLNGSLIEHFEYKLEHLLKWEDHNSMAHSIESRVPFLDHNLVERTLSLPADHIIRNATTKWYLRESMKGTLPEAIRNRQDKIGFATPWDEWLRAPSFQERIMGLLQSTQFKQRGYLIQEKCIKDYQRHVKGEINIAKEIWKWLNLELWFQTFFN